MSKNNHSLRSWNFQDLTGERFGRLLVVEFIGVNPKGTEWKTICDCGTEYSTFTNRLKSGNTSSCGCLREEQSYKHGLSKTPEYTSWANMLGRCANKKSKYYGARGVKVCERWRDFMSFLEDMERKPTPKHSIDRIDNDGDYCPSNCRWATKKEQSLNTRANRYICYNGIEKTLSEWSEYTGIKRNTIDGRLASGWSLEDALS